MTVRVYVDAWEPGYGTSGDGEGGSGPATPSSARIDPDVEVPAAEWRPMDPPAGAAAPEVVLIVDGVRRIDARIWVDEGDETRPGIAASYAAGVVRCDLAAGAAALSAATVARGLFSGVADLTPLTAHAAAVYRAHQVTGGEPKHLDNMLQARLRDLEIEVSSSARIPDDLLVVDGPLKGRTSLPRTIGYIKTHRSQYLPPELAGVVAALRPGQRTPVFLLGTNWNRYAWYLRLPGPPGAAWAGMVRAECAADLPVEEVVALAGRSAATLPRLASAPYKDPRAPQNLVPIAGLERRLRALLGDSRLLLRGLRVAAATATT